MDGITLAKTRVTRLWNRMTPTPGIKERCRDIAGQVQNHLFSYISIDNSCAGPHDNLYVRLSNSGITRAFVGTTYPDQVRKALNIAMSRTLTGPTLHKLENMGVFVWNTDSQELVKFAISNFLPDYCMTTAGRELVMNSLLSKDHGVRALMMKEGRQYIDGDTMELVLTNLAELPLSEGMKRASHISLIAAEHPFAKEGTLISFLPLAVGEAEVTIYKKLGGMMMPAAMVERIYNQYLKYGAEGLDRMVTLFKPGHANRLKLFLIKQSAEKSDAAALCLSVLLREYPDDPDVAELKQ